MHVDAAQLETHRAALTGHCYRMLGSAFDADDAVQETMVRAWRGLERFDGRASLKTWMYRIATNVCLDALSDKSRRARPIEEGPVGTVDDELAVHRGHRHLQTLGDFGRGPAQKYTLWLRSPETIHTWLLGRGNGCRGSRLVPTAACGLPAFGQYRPGGPRGSHHPWALIVPELADDRITGWNSFLDTEKFFPLFGLRPYLTE